MKCKYQKINKIQKEKTESVVIQANTKHEENSNIFKKIVQI